MTKKCSIFHNKKHIQCNELNAMFVAAKQNNLIEHIDANKTVIHEQINVDLN